MTIFQIIILPTAIISLSAGAPLSHFARLGTLAVCGGASAVHGPTAAVR